MLQISIRHIDEFRGSGLTDEILAAHKIWSIDQSESEKLLGFRPKSGGWAIEYPGTNGTGPGFVRIKPDVPFVDENGRPAKYLTPKDAGCRLFVPTIYGEKDLHFGKAPIIVTEGEKKVLKGAQDLPGFVVVGLAGVWAFRQKEKGLIPDFKQKVRWTDRDVFIVYDSDACTKREVRDAEDALAVQLDKLGAGSIQICRLPSGPNGEKVGLDDFLIRHSPETFAEQVINRAALWSPRGRLFVDDAMTFSTKRLEHREDIIAGGILPARSTAFITAYSKIGKSILAGNLSISLACGRAFLDQFRVPRPFRVLFVNEEVDEGQMQARLNKMMRSAKDRGFSGFENLQIVNRTGIRIDTDEGFKTAARILRFSKPEVVIWDCLYRLHSKNENKAEDMQNVLGRFDSLAARFGVAQVLIHHHGLPQKDSGRDNFQLMRGSSVLGAVGDSYLSLTRLKKTESPNFQRLAFNLRNAADPDDLVLYRNPDTLWYEVSSDPEAKEKLTVQNVVFALKEMGGRAQRQELINKLTVDYKAGERTAINKITEAVKLDRINQGKGDDKKTVEYWCQP